MNVFEVALQGAQILSGLSLIILVLLHSPKGDGLGGLSSAGKLFSSQRGAEDSLNKLTLYVAGAFYLSSFILGYYVH